jgi:hypothetical protein
MWIPRTVRVPPRASSSSRRHEQRGCGRGRALDRRDALCAVWRRGLRLRIWSLVAGSGERGRHARRLIDWAIGPVWEANHVWLIFMLVTLWTGFPEAFGSVMSTLFIPLSLAALRIVLRGAGFAFQRVAARTSGRASPRPRSRSPPS